MNRVEQPENATTANSVDISDFFLKIKIGEKAALFDLYDRTSGLLFGLTLKILGNPAEAEETLLNIYTRIWKDPLSCSPDFPPLAQLVMIARSHALTRLYETRRSYVSVKTASTTDDDCKKTTSKRGLIASVFNDFLTKMSYIVEGLIFAPNLSLCIRRHNKTGMRRLAIW